MPHAVPIVFLFALGACIGSFLNVVVWRLPRDESLVTPPSRCPKCGNQLKWYDNVPVFGWIWLRGKCRFCAQPISPRYPIVEAITGLLFVFYYVMYFIKGGHAPPWPVSADMAGQSSSRLLECKYVEFSQGWPIYALYMLAICVLLAASLIDAENFFIPIGMLWYLLVPAAIAWHAITDKPYSPGTLVASATTAAMAAGGGIGVLLSFILWRFGILPQSFPDGGPLLEVERAEIEKERAAAKAEGREPDVREGEEPQYTPAQVRREMRKEMLFLFPPVLLAGVFVILTLKFPTLRDAWDHWTARTRMRAMFGSIFGLLIGAFVVWLTRILGTIGFGREAMGMGDVHLMAGVGAVIGAGASTVAFFIAPFFGIALAIYMLLTGKRRELPYGPYLSMGTAAVMVFYCDIANWLSPGLIGMRMVVSSWFS